MSKNIKGIHLKNCSFTKKGIKYNYYALAEANKVDGKNQKTIIKYLGALSETQVDSYRHLLHDINEGKASAVDLSTLTFLAKKDFLNVAVLHELWKKLELPSAFKTNLLSRKEVSTGEIAEILVLSKLLKPSSNTGTVEWFTSTYLSNLMEIDPATYNRMKIFNELSLITDSKESIEDRLFRLARSQNEDEFEVFFIDGTTTYFEGTECELAKAGKDKTNGYKTHMILIMLVTDKYGYPCAWDVYDGSTKEITKFKDIAKRICEKYKITNITFCFDRGFASTKNFDVIEGFLSKFISGIDKDQIIKIFDVEKFKSTRDKLIEATAVKAASITTTCDNAKARRMPIDGFYTADGERYYKDLGVKDSYRYVVGFSTEIFQAEQTSREQAELAAFLELAELNSELAHAKKDRDLDKTAKRADKIIEDYQMQNFITYTITPLIVKHRTTIVQSCVLKYALNTKALHSVSLTDGIFIYISDHTEKNRMDIFNVSAYDIVHCYKNKNVIERDFRDLKNVINIRPLFVRLPKHVKALIAIAVIAQFMNVFIRRKLEEIGMSLKEFYTLLEKSSPVASLKTPKRTINKLIETQPELIKALEVIGLKDTVFSARTMAILN